MDALEAGLRLMYMGLHLRAPFSYSFFPLVFTLELYALHTQSLLKYYAKQRFGPLASFATYFV